MPFGSSTMAYSTEEAYAQWIRRYILFHNKRHPRETGKPEIEAFLIHLALHQTWNSVNECLSLIH
mgnify:CR=1 FL=1